MQYPQVLIYESDGRLAEQFRREGEQSKPRQWVLREARSADACLRLLRGGAPTALVLKTGKDLVRELALADRVKASYPDTAIIVVGDTDNPVLAGLAWDLGASLVLFPPLPRQWLVEITTGLLTRAAHCQLAAAGAEPALDVLLPDEEA
jgi:DNA-binding NarL/FixJ family response regulator